VAIVLLAVFKNNLPTDITAWVIFGMIIAWQPLFSLYAKKTQAGRKS